MMTSPHDAPATRGATSLVIETLRREGTLTFERLLECSGLDWPQMFFAIDELSRSGKVWLQRVPEQFYRISLNGEGT